MASSTDYRVIFCYCLVLSSALLAMRAHACPKTIRSAGGGSSKPGCYGRDSTNEDQDDAGVFPVANMTSEICRNKCLAHSIQSKLVLMKQRLCLCGFSVDRGSMEIAEMCDFRCEGDDREWCGSENYVSAYPMEIPSGE